MNTIKSALPFRFAIQAALAQDTTVFARDLHKPARVVVTLERNSLVSAKAG